MGQTITAGSYVRSGESAEIPNALLVSARGCNKGAFVSHSHFAEPIDLTDGEFHGRSRCWGDADKETQRKVVRAFLEESRLASLSVEDTAFLLAVARFESGFNPDAASRSSSASGVGQLIDRTGLAYGIGKDNRFRVRDNIRAMIGLINDNARFIQNRFKPRSDREEQALLYAVYHDGPSLGFEGLKLAREEVLPWTRRFLSWLSGPSAPNSSN